MAHLPCQRGPAVAHLPCQRSVHASEASWGGRGGGVGEAWACVSADRARCDDEVRYAPEEVLNSLDVPGLPKHELKLKRNMPIMLLRNLSPSDGLCNGTRLLVLDVINDRLLKAEIVTGKHRGDVVYIPRIQLSPDEGVFPFEWSRRQFPVRVAFAMVRAIGPPTICVASRAARLRL